MSGKMMAKAVGWLSIGVGLVALVAPPRIGGLVGYVEKPVLLRLVGVRDLCIGAGLLRRSSSCLKFAERTCRGPYFAT